MTKTSASDLERLQRRFERERAARKEAERLLEERSLELYHANRDLEAQAVSLEAQVAARTAELKQAVIAAESAASAKANFLAVMSHEIRTPLNGVIGMAELLAMEELSQEQFEQLQTIQSCSHHLLELINNILEFSKLESGRMKLDLQPFDLSQDIQNWISTFKASNQKSHVTLETHLGPLPRKVKGDKTRLRQVLFNLVGNAFKFTEQGCVQIDISSIEEEKGIRLFFRISDTGVGIEPEQFKTLFTPFHQASPQIQKRFGGTGLGLAISKILIESMDGSIDCSSHPAEGTTFEFSVLLERDDETHVSTPAGQEPDHTTPPIKILLVEDVEVNQMLATRMLRKLGHDIDLAETGEQAVEMARHHPYDLILMDMILPGMDGREATLAIRQLPLDPQPYIIAVTANAFREDKEKCLVAGMDAFMPKPFLFADLKREISLAYQSQQN